MKKRRFIGILLTFAMVLGMIVVPQSPISLVGKVEASITNVLRNGAIYRIKSAKSNRYLEAMGTGNGGGVAE